MNPLYQALNALSKVAVSSAGLFDVLPELAVVLIYIVLQGGLAVFLYEKRVTA